MYIKEQPHTVVKVKGGVIIFFLFLKGSLGLMREPLWKEKTWSNQPRGVNTTYGVYSWCVCLRLVSFSLVPVGVHVHLWVSVCVFLPVCVWGKYLCSPGNSLVIYILEAVGHDLSLSERFTSMSTQVGWGNQLS